MRNSSQSLLLLARSAKQLLALPFLTLVINRIQPLIQGQALRQAIARRAAETKPLLALDLSLKLSARYAIVLDTMLVSVHEGRTYLNPQAGRRDRQPLRVLNNLNNI